MKIFRSIFPFLVIFFLFTFSSVVYADEFNAGFVNGLWYSHTPFFAGDNVRIYTVIQNQSGFDITGSVTFFDNDKLLSQSDFSIVNGRLIEQWADWVPITGKHNISVKLSKIKKLEIGKQPVAIELANSQYISEVYEVDVDTDGDKIGDRDDLDDDGDGISDKEEIVGGTDPLVFNKKELIEPSDGDSLIKSSSQTDTQQEDDITGEILAEANQLLDLVSEKAIKTVGNTKTFLEKHQKKIDEEIEKEKQEELLKDEPQINKEKNPYVASLVDNLPDLKEIYSFLLSVLIYILNSWWILLGSLVVVLYFIFKLSRQIFRRRY